MQVLGGEGLDGFALFNATKLRKSQKTEEEELQGVGDTGREGNAFVA